MATNTDVELKLAHRIPEFLREAGILPEGYQCEVHLHRGNRKKRRDAEFEGNWDPDTDSIRIAFSPREEEIETTADEVAASSKTANPGPAEDRLSDLLRALGRAEGRPGYEFVSLKWFRDTALVHEGFQWAADESARHDALREAIDRRWILTSKVANPRPPHFPVTAIRLNRQMPEVNAVLGNRAGSLPAFRPVSIRGEPLSATVLSDRR
ncbi:MAG TPA: hypothetical protein VGR45_09855 [Stellaceae bacterium]|nr:hypothetical protein [Stellaceae bacterium]HEV2302219.1 hypothetical protein [Stellaceae bacterium]